MKKFWQIKEGEIHKLSNFLLEQSLLGVKSHEWCEKKCKAYEGANGRSLQFICSKCVNY